MRPARKNSSPDRISLRHEARARKARLRIRDAWDHRDPSVRSCERARPFFALKKLRIADRFNCRTFVAGVSALFKKLLNGHRGDLLPMD